MSLRAARRLVRIVDHQGFSGCLAIRRQRRFLRSVLVGTRVIRIVRDLRVYESPGSSGFLGLTTDNSTGCVMAKSSSLLVLGVCNNIRMLGTESFVRLFS